MARLVAAEAGHDAEPRDRPPDLRLAGLAVATWISALLTLRTTAPVAAAVAVGAALPAIGLLGFVSAPLAGPRRRRPRTRPALGKPGPRRPGRICRAMGRLGGIVREQRWTALAVLLGVVCGSAGTAARLAVRDAPALVQPVRASSRVTAEFTVRDDPRALPGPAGRPGSYLIRARLSWLAVSAPGHPGGTERNGGPAQDRVAAPVRLIVLASDPGWSRLLPGQRVRAEGRLAAPRGGDLTGAVLMVSGAPVPLARPSWPQRAAGRLRAGLQAACVPLPDEPGGLLPGLVVGDTSRLPDRVAGDFRATGMTHLNAVSGSNVAIVLGLVLGLARWCRAGPRLSAVLCAVALAGFVILVRPSPSVLRAAAMGSVALLALATGRSRAAVPALAATVTALVLSDPDLAADPGFALSTLATSGLLLIAPGWRAGLRRRGVPAGLAEAIAVPAAAQLACSPVIAALSGTVSLVAVPANLLVAPAIAPATVLGVTAAVVSPVWPGAAAFAAWLASWPARWLVLVARYGAELPAGALPWPAGTVGALLLATVTVGLLVAVRRPLVRRLVAAVAAAALVGAVPVRILAGGWPPAGWLLVACAVGQGDALVLSVAPGQAVVVDAGPEPVAVDRCLRRLAIREIPLVVLSHFHLDHVGGFAGVLRGRHVGAVLVPQWREPAGGYRLVVDAAAAARLPIRAAEPSDELRVGGADLSVLDPAPPLRGTRSDPNNNSLVLRIRAGGLRLLLPGDAETEEQQLLLGSRPPDDLRADVLKVAHHGSAYQDPAFLDRVAPAVALVSVGLDNDYGHPSATVLDRLARRGARVLRTDADGDLAVSVRGGRPAVTARGWPAGERRQ
ncbi:ComEC/Rec2 family competence protein [Plantactinospora siamensis]|uniref:ComEC/Rec2 family competence protein n=1 Tax=Plantactinospora siamensis TaxID=555372 RepID=A0ABV6NUJ4_9ACTN